MLCWLGRLCLCAGLLLATMAGAEEKVAHRLLSGEATAINPRYLLVGPGGQAVTNEDFRGRFQLISFGYTFCPDICPTTLSEMAEVLRRLGETAGQVQALFISVDPERDTRQVLQTYTAFFDPRIIGLTGSPALVSRAAQNFKVRYAKVVQPGGDPRHYAVDHAAGMFLLGPDGQFLKKFAYGTDVQTLTEAIAGILRQGPGDTGKP